jgi:crotonobetainyl-CoA:carnitine CoA-transferase CaiB-like acyl-CoA transferase
MSKLNCSLPLAGVRVLDLSRVLAGPWCAMVLGDLGAEVIKVEHPKRGDDTRDWGARVGTTETAYFNSVNRNKRSVCLDLQTAEGQRIARELAQQSDVVIQNFKFGGAEKLGLGYDQLNEAHEDLIYCSISGYDRCSARASDAGLHSLWRSAWSSRGAHFEARGAGRPRLDVHASRSR